jgi:hypothetical protein
MNYLHPLAKETATNIENMMERLGIDQGYLAVLRFGPSCWRRPRTSARPAPAPSPPTAPAAAPAFAPIRDPEFAKKESATAVDAAAAAGAARSAPRARAYGRQSRLTRCRIDAVLQAACWARRLISRCTRLRYKPLPRAKRSGGPS